MLLITLQGCSLSCCVLLCYTQLSRYLSPPFSLFLVDNWTEVQTAALLRMSGLQNIIGRRTSQAYCVGWSNLCGKVCHVPSWLPFEVPSLMLFSTWFAVLRPTFCSSVCWVCQDHHLVQHSSAVVAAVVNSTRTHLCGVRGWDDALFHLSVGLTVSPWLFRIQNSTIRFIVWSWLWLTFFSSFPPRVRFVIIVFMWKTRCKKYIILLSSEEFSVFCKRTCNKVHTGNAWMNLSINRW